jgi:hypothetical protein
MFLITDRNDVNYSFLNSLFVPVFKIRKNHSDFSKVQNESMEIPFSKSYFTIFTSCILIKL